MFKGYLQYGHLLCKKKNWNWYLQQSQDKTKDRHKEMKTPTHRVQNVIINAFLKVYLICMYILWKVILICRILCLWLVLCKKQKKCKIARISGFWTLDLVRVMVILSNSKVTLSESLTKCGHRAATADKVFLKIQNKLFSNHWYERISKGHDVLPCLKQILVIHGGVSN